MAELYVNVGGTWKTASNYYVNVNGTWKEGSELHAKVSSAWKQSAAVAASLTSSNLVQHLDANNSSSYESGDGEAWTDLSSSGNDGNIQNGPTFENSGTPKYFDLDGTDDHVINDNNNTFDFGTGDFTIAVWARLDSISWRQPIFSTADDGGFSTANYVQLAGNSTNKFRLFLRNAAGDGWAFRATTDGDYSTDTWYYFLVTRDGNDYKLYINNSEVASDSLTGSLVDHDEKYLRLATNAGQSQFLDGRISECHVYLGLALSSAQRTANWNATKSTYGY